MEVSLNEIGEIITGNTPSKSDTNFWNSPDICFIKPDVIAEDEITELLDSNEYISENARNKARIVNENSILVTCIGSIAKIGIVKIRECAFNQQINAIIPNKNIDTKYLCYCLQNSKVKLKAIANAPVVPIINKKQFGEFVVKIDGDISTQKKIVNRLDYIQSVITLYKIQLQKFDDLIKARFIEMFGTLDDPADEFEKATLKKLCNKITDGKHGGCTSEEGTQRYFVGAREIYDDEVHYDTAPEINVEEFEKDYKRCNIEIGDFLIVNTGATIGKSAIASDERTEHTLLQKSVALLKVKKDKLNPVFLKWCYRVNTRMYMIQSASAQPNLLLSKINGTVIYVPSIELQNQFVDFVQQVDKSRFDIKKSITELEREVVYD